MNHRAFFFVLFSLFPLSGFADSGTFCVQSFNVYGPAYASSVEYRLSLLGEEILRDPCPVTQFQEFWRDSHYQDFTEQLAPAHFSMVRPDALRKDKAMTGLASAFAGAVLSSDSQVFVVNNEDGFLDWIRDLSGVQKGFSYVKARATGAPEANYVNLHTHPSNEAIRLAQITQLLGFLLSAPAVGDAPLLLTGDLNATPDSAELALLRDVLLLRDSYREVHGDYGDACTYCHENPLSWSFEDRVIDFVLVRNAPGLALTARRSEINLRGMPYQPLSDHYGLRSTFEWQEREARRLPPTDVIVQARIAKAIAALQKAQAGLKGNTAFVAAANYLRSLEQIFAGGTLPAELESIFLTP